MAVACLAVACGQAPQVAPAATTTAAIGDSDATTLGEVSATEGAGETATVDALQDQVPAAEASAEASTFDLEAADLNLEDSSLDNSSTVDSDASTFDFMAADLNLEDSSLDNSSTFDSDASTFDSGPAGLDTATEVTASVGCQQSSDCAAQEDGNLCNGSLYCDLVSAKCAINPATVVTCPTDLDTTCAKAACAPATGKCALKAVKDGSLCSDGQKCTEGDVCIGGLCSAGEDICVCKFNADCAVQEDGNQCNGTLFCNKATGKCQLNPATVVTCPSVDDTACTKNQCQPKTGKCAKTNAAANLPCDDGNPCTPNEACQSGQCLATANTCECAKDADCLAKDDGNL